ncbi:hypothetical protein P2W68_17915 [Chryseobacterium arthrosphaerae]|uniref:hypothetical protein n=1 Tax=Chryseobacterium arthrosphaerae TaxID=651561 RepID=UPI0023E305F3|nr:hypothetical protein [Chryseobacterium arthrosphaerae]WES96712.1 hypothetical protein P2W68_17915 [Chryseobacterium arthrosphaerae]
MFNRDTKKYIMKTKTLLLGSLVFGSFLFSQVGVNNSNPQATLDVTAKTTDGSKPEGLIAPRLTGDQIRSANTSYTAAQTGTIIYATSADSSPSGKTINITAPGYYYFDGSVWQKIITGNTVDSTNDAWVNDSGNSMVKLGTRSDGVTARAAGADVVIKDNGYMGIGNVAPNAKLDARTNTTSTSDPGAGIIGIGTTTMAANAAGAGAMRYSTNSGGTLEYSNGTDWNTLTSTVKKSLVYGYLTNGQSLSTGDGTFAVTEIFDQNNNFASNTFTVPRTGSYSISLCGLTTSTTWNQSDEFSIRVEKNGTVQVIGYWAAPTSSSYYGGTCTSVSISANAGESITFTYYLKVGGKTVHTPNFNRFSIQEL